MGNDYKPVPIKPLTGPMDVRSDPDAMASPVRYRLNWWTNRKGRMARLPGWSKLLPSADYQNADLHDQLLALQTFYSGDDTEVGHWPNDVCGDVVATRTRGREPITLLFETETTAKSKGLIAGTQSRLYEMNGSSRNYRLLGDGYGGNERDDLEVRFRAAQVKNTVILTNNVDPPMSYQIGDDIQGCAMRATREIPDLATIGLSRAKYIIAFKGYIILGDVVMDGRRLKGTAVWAAFNRPTAFDPANLQNDCGVQELPGQEIRGFAEMGDVMYVYCDKEIWTVQTTGNSEAPLSFVRFYTHKDSKSCLAYPNTLISVGRDHYYMGEDDIYTVNPYVSEPQKINWISQGSGLIYDDLNTQCGAGTFASYNPSTDCIFIFWCRAGQYIPQDGFLFHPKRRFTSYVDFGATAGVTFNFDERPNFRDYMRSLCACSGDEYLEMFTKEAAPPEAEACETEPDSIWSDQTVTIDGLVTEDFEGESTENALVARMVDESGACPKSDDLCAQCSLQRMWIIASSEDWCLKQFGNGLSREYCVNPDAIGVTDKVTVEPGVIGDVISYTSATGEYRYDPFLTEIKLGPMDVGFPEPKQVSYLTVNADVDGSGSAPPGAAVGMTVGYHHNPVDPLSQDCDVVWHKPEQRALRCWNTRSGAAYADDHLAPAMGIEAPFLVEGPWIYLDIKIGVPLNATDRNSPVVAGVCPDCTVSAATMSVKRMI